MTDKEQLGDKMKYTTLGNFLKTNYLDKTKPNSMSMSELSVRLDISRQLLYLVMTGRQKLSTALARRMSEVLGRKPIYYLNLDRNEIIEIEDISYEDFNQKELISHWLKMGGRTLVNKDIDKAVQLGIIKIQPFNFDCLKHTSYEFTISSQMIDQKYKFEFEVEKDNTLVLLPRASVSISSEQMIQLPNYIYCRSSPLLYDDFIINTNPHLGPGYKGHINANILNLAEDKTKIPSSLPIVTLEFIFLPVSPTFEKADTKSHFKENLIDTNNNYN